MYDEYEDIEWVNYWIENNNKKKILIVGDSVARQFRKIINKLLKDEFAVDLIATSCYPGLAKCSKIIEDYFTEGLSYEIIIVNLGAHHGYKYSTRFSKEAEIGFTSSISKIYKFLSKKCKRLIVLSGTPEAALYNDNNLEIMKRNEIMKNICHESGQYQYIDIFGIMEKKYDYADGWCHFRGDGDCCIAQRLLESIMGEFPQINMVATIKSFWKILENEKKIYIFGNGKRGNALRQYLCNNKFIVCGIIVSPEYRNDDFEPISLENVEKNAIILVTPLEVNIIKSLTENRYKYFFFG